MLVVGGAMEVSRIFSTPHGGDNLPKSSPSRPHSPRGSHGIYKHISFYWYPTKNQNLNPPTAEKLIFSENEIFWTKNHCVGTRGVRGGY